MPSRTFDEIKPNYKPGEEWPMYRVWKGDKLEPCMECGRETAWHYPNCGSVCSIECQTVGYRKAAEFEAANCGEDEFELAVIDALALIEPVEEDDYCTD